jgi:hypothetical protein
VDIDAQLEAVGATDDHSLHVSIGCWNLRYNYFNFAHICTRILLQTSLSFSDVLSPNDDASTKPTMAVTDSGPLRMRIKSSSRTEADLSTHHFDGWQSPINHSQPEE